MMGHPLGTVLYFGLGILGVGCAEANYCPVPTEQVVEMLTWWTQTGEAAARQKLVDRHTDRMQAERRETWVNATTMDNNSFVRNFLWTNRDRKRRLPDTFQVNIGQDLLNWKEQLEAVDFLLDDEEPGLRDKFFEPVLTEASDNGVLYGIPLDIHRTNTVFYNRDTVRELVQSEEDIDTLEKFERICAALKLKNPERSPIVLGTKGAAWTLGLLAHESLFPSLWGVRQYRSLWRGAATTQGDEYFNPLWKVYEKLLDWKDRGWINADFAETTWTDAANRLFAPDTDAHQAAFFIMGDWVQAELRLKNAADKLKRAPFPHADGADSVFVYTADSFPLPKNNKNRQNAVDLLHTMMGKETQLAFSAAKGSIPARIDLWGSDILPYNQVYIEFLDAIVNHQVVLAVSGCLRQNEMPSVDDQLEEMLVTGNIDKIKQFWTENYRGLNPTSRRCFQSE
jgi:glucose/mannose transport system substrate-binding protein